QQAPRQQAQPQQPAARQQPAPDYDSFDDDIPF
ncbi:MAG TPA: single-stranded DNA-binding protein, partial [Pseudomonas sp.]|nr:single-stranded DNA-binding protein [Pseudomonas sp.]